MYFIIIILMMGLGGSVLGQVDCTPQAGQLG